MSPFTSFVLFHDALSSVLENTTFGSLFIRFGHNRHILDRRRCRPEAGHEFVGNPAEHQLASATGVPLDKFIPLRILLVGPAHVAVRVGKVTIQRHVIEND